MAIDGPILETDIEVNHWVPAPNSMAKNITVPFTRKNKRDDYLKHARKCPITCDDIDAKSRAPVSVNEHLCPALKKIASDNCNKKMQLEVCLGAKR